MALNTYDSSRHHIGLRARDVPATTYGFMLEGGYSQELQREGVGAPDFGGATDIIGQVPSLSRWTQDDFIGGMFQFNWGRDDAMFADSLNFMPDPQGRSLYSCPPMFYKEAIDVSGETGYVSNEPKAMFMVGGVIFIVFGHGIKRYAIDTAVESWVGAGANTTFVMAGYNPDDQKIWVCCNSSVGGDRPFIRRLNTDLTSPSFDAEFTGPTGTEDLQAYGMSLRDSNVVVGIGRKVWVGVPPANPDATENGTISWTNVGHIPGRDRKSVV